MNKIVQALLKEEHNYDDVLSQMQPAFYSWYDLASYANDKEPWPEELKSMCTGNPYSGDYPDNLLCMIKEYAGTVKVNGVTYEARFDIFVSYEAYDDNTGWDISKFEIDPVLEQMDDEGDYVESYYDAAVESISKTAYNDIMRKARKAAKELYDMLTNGPESQ